MAGDEPSGLADGLLDNGVLLYFRGLASWLAGELALFFAWALVPPPLHSLCQEAAWVPASKRVVRPTER